MTSVSANVKHQDDETFFFSLSNPKGATLAKSTATVTIGNDDTTTVLPVLSIAGSSQAEGNSGKSDALLTVSLSAASAQTVKVNYATANGTASKDSDYLAASGTLTFPPGVTSQTLHVTVLGDTTQESDETVKISLSSPSNAVLNSSASSASSATLTIRDDDTPPPPVLSIADASKTEGDSGSSKAELTVSLSAASKKTVTVDYATADGTATDGSDYIAMAGSLSFAPGETSKTISIPILGDSTAEDDETSRSACFHPAMLPWAAPPPPLP